MPTPKVILYTQHHKSKKKLITSITYDQWKAICQHYYYKIKKVVYIGYAIQQIDIDVLCRKPI